MATTKCSHPRCTERATVRVLFLSPTDPRLPTSLHHQCRRHANDIVARTVRSDLLRLVPIQGDLP